MRRGKNFEWKDFTSNLKEISSSICYATPKEHLKNRLIQSNPKRKFKKKTFTISSHQAIKFPTDRVMSTRNWPTSVMTMN